MTKPPRTTVIPVNESEGSNLKLPGQSPHTVHRKRTHFLAWYFTPNSLATMSLYTSLKPFPDAPIN